MSASGIEILRAGPEDEAELRALLRAQPLPGWVEISFEREPDYFAAAAIEGERQGVLLARQDGTPHIPGRLVAICARNVRRVFVDGKAQLLGYVGQFRTIGSVRTGWPVYRLLKQGFRAVHGLRRPDELPFDITSILSGNTAARRLLSAELKGLPVYRRIGGLNTLVFRCAGSRAEQSSLDVESGATASLGSIAECLQRNYRRYQFAPVWDEASLAAVGLHADDFLVVRSGEKVTACVAIWDQRKARQMIVRGYRQPLGLLRPLINIAAPWFGVPALPRNGEALRQAWLSHLACDGDSATAFEGLLPAALAQAGRLGLDQVMLGLTDRHPLLPAARSSRRHLVYRSDVYIIDWPGSQAMSERDFQRLTARPTLPETATL